MNVQKNTEGGLPSVVQCFRPLELASLNVDHCASFLKVPCATVAMGRRVCSTWRRLRLWDTTGSIVYHIIDHTDGGNARILTSTAHTGLERTVTYLRVVHVRGVVLLILRRGG